jgi:hypothetical protein
MEQQNLAASTEVLVQGLSYAKKPTAQYVTGRTSHTYFPSGGNQYSINGVRVLRLDLQTAGDDFLDPATVRLAFKLINKNATNPLALLSNSPLCIFQRMRVLCRGTLVEDVNYLHRIVQMFHILLPEQRRKAESLQMMGG